LYPALERSRTYCRLEKPWNLWKCTRFCEAISFLALDCTLSRQIKAMVVFYCRKRAHPPTFSHGLLSWGWARHLCPHCTIWSRVLWNNASHDQFWETYDSSTSWLARCSRRSICWWVASSVCLCGWGIRQCIAMNFDSM